MTGTLETASEKMYQEEAARRELLTHLGLTPLVSRFDPVGAMPAARYVMPQSAHIGGAVAQADTQSRPGPGLGHGENGEAVVSTDSEMQGDHLRALLRDDYPGISSPAGDEVDSTPSQPTDPTPKMVEQRLSLLIVVTQDVLWVEQLHDQLLRNEQLQLVAAMARAIRGSSVNCEHQQFDWPPAGGLKMSQENGLEQMLSGYLQRLVADNQSQVMIQMGAVDVLPVLSLPVHRIPASLTMLQEPETKRDAWSVLKLLVRSG